MFKRPTLLMALGFIMMAPHFASSQEQADSTKQLNDPAFKKWLKSVAEQPAEQQIEIVVKKLQDMNKGYNGKLTGQMIRDDAVDFMAFSADRTLSDISPLHALPKLRGLSVDGTNVSDLTPLKGMGMKRITFGHTPVHDLGPLKGMPLNLLFCQSTKVSDLTPLAGAPLEEVNIADTLITDISPLKGMPLREVTLTLKKITKGIEVLRNVETLEVIRVKTGDQEKEFTPDEFWTKYDARKSK